MVHSKLKTYAEGTQHDDENRITGVIRTLYRAIDKDPDFVDDVSISATSWHTEKTATALDEEITETLQTVKITKKQTAVATKLGKILKVVRGPDGVDMSADSPDKSRRLRRIV